MRRHAYEDGRRLFASALSIGRQTLGDFARCRLLLSLAAAQSLTSDLAGALQTCREVVDQGVRLGRPEIAGEAALVPEPTFDPEIDRVIRALCEQAMSALGDAPTSLRARVLAQYAVVCDHLSDLDAAHPAVEEALALAEGSGDTSAIEAALIAHHLVRSGPDGLAEREANADRMWELGSASAVLHACLTASEWRFDAGCERGDLARAAREVETIARWAIEIGGPMSHVAAAALPGDAGAGPGPVCRRASVRRRGVGHDGGHRVPAGVPAVGRVPVHPVPSDRADHRSRSGRLGITDADATEQDWPIPGVMIPTLAAGEHAGRCRTAAGGRR